MQTVYSPCPCPNSLGLHLDQHSCTEESCQGLAVTKLTKSGDSEFSGFDLFEVPPNNTFILQGDNEEHQSLSGGSEKGEIE